MRAPDALRGRIMSIYQLDHALTPLSYTLLGACADLFSAPAAMAASGLLGLVSVVVLMASVKQIRELRKL
jgi:hypothetical protein